MNAMKGTQSIAFSESPYLVSAGSVAGKKEGTVLWVNGTVHGDELNGSYAAWELSRVSWH